MSAPQTRQQRAADLLEVAQGEHEGIFLTGPEQVSVLSDSLPSSAFDGTGFVLASFGNCRCASDAKAIRQFDSHARVPNGTGQVASLVRPYYHLYSVRTGSGWSACSGRSSLLRLCEYLFGY